MKKTLLMTAFLAFTALGLAACDDPASTEPAAGDTTEMSAPTSMTNTTDMSETTAATPETVPSEPVVVPEETAPAASSDIMAQEGADIAPAPTAAPTCDFSSLVGKKLTDIDQASFKRPVRVLYPDSAATMDFNPERINIILEKETDVVTEVRCG